MPVELKLFDVKEPNFEQEFRHIADNAVAEMRNLVKKRSGFTADNIQNIVTNRGYTIYGAGRSYQTWHLLEYGTPTAPAYPFVRPITNKLAPKNDEIITKILQASVKLK